MRLTNNTQIHDGLGQLQTVLSAMWGLAARAQSQSTPGASALAAPPAILARTFRKDVERGFRND